MAGRIAGCLLVALLTTGCAAQAQAGEITTATKPPPTTTTTVSTTTKPPPPPPPPPCAAPVEACVSLSAKQAWLMNDGIVVYGPVPITYGRPGNPTPTDTFSVAWKDEVHTSSRYGTPMPYSVFFASGGIAFHEGSLTEDSHGCVHLGPEAAKVFFDALVRGDVVQVVP